MIDRMLSKWVERVIRVTHSSVLGPIPFVCYVNDLPQEETSLLYADDIQMSRNCIEEVDREILQKDLNKLCERADKWLRFNVVSVR